MTNTALCPPKANELEMTARQLLKENKTRLLLNLAQAPYIDSNGLAMLLFIQRELKKVSGVLKLTGLSPGLKKIFEVTKLDTTMAVFESEESALKAFEG